MNVNAPSPPERMRSLLWIGAGGAAAAAFAGMLGFHDGSVWRMPDALKERVGAALQSAGYPGLDIDMKGQRAVLRGIVGDEGAIAIVGRAAAHAAGPGGAWAGGVTSVDTSGLSVGAIERPFVWSIRRDDTRVILSGAVPSEDARAELMTTASAVFPNAEAVDDMRVVGGAPASNWKDMARHVVRALATLNQGEARISDAQIAIIGDGAFDAVDRLRGAYAAPQPPFRAQVAVSVDGLDVTHPELQGIDLRAGEVGACRQALSRVTEGAPIAFAAGSAMIESTSLPRLDAIVSVALRCDRNTIDIRGPADGGAALSLQRAQALAALFAGEGVLRDRIRAMAGAGPAATFAVNAGTERNP